MSFGMFAYKKTFMFANFPQLSPQTKLIHYLFIHVQLARNAVLEPQFCLFIFFDKNITLQTKEVASCMKIIFLRPRR